MIDHDCYLVAYDSSRRHAAYVRYTLKPSDLQGNADRKNNFKPDPYINSERSAQNEDYYKSGFDRGHLCPAADMVVSQGCMDKSFYYSNISPQLPGFNRGIWKKLETQVREWCANADSLKIYVGPVFSESDTTLGPNRIAVPQYYFKTILRYNQNSQSMIGFIMNNTSSKEELHHFVRTIDDIEAKISLNLYPFLSNEMESALESDMHKTDWFNLKQ
jgi:endonuclease G